jgi:hypothetical protein
MSGIAQLFGVNEYPNAPLNGCVNDVKNIAALLWQRYGYSFTDIHTTLNGRATARGMLDRLESFVREAPEHEWSIIADSGHGATYPRDEEEDGDGECLCPVDYDGTEEHCVTDVQFCDILNRKNLNANILIILDTCFSGGMSRDIGDINQDKSRLYPGSMRTGNAVSSITSLLPPRVILLSGASEGQTGSDAFISGAYNGAFTYFLMETVRLELAKTYREIIEIVNKNLADHGFEQRATLQGDYELFDEFFMGRR